MRWLCIVTVAIAAAWTQPVRAAEPAHAEAAHGDHHGPHIGEDVSATAKDPKEVRLDLGLFTLAVFVLLFLGLRAAAWPKIASNLDAREEGIRRAITDAEKARLDAAEMIRQHQAKLDSVQDEVKAIIAEARLDAERTKTDIVASANTEATAIKNRAIAEIDRAKDQALHEVFSNLADQVAKATEQVVGRTVTGDDQSRFIREALAQVSPN